MLKDNRPRWRHKCPGCRRTIFWESVYCLPCITLYPERSRFKLKSSQRRIKQIRLTGIPRSKDHLFVVVNQDDGLETLCVECGRQIRKNFEHRCGGQLDRYIISKNNLKCRACDGRKRKEYFPLIRKGKRKNLVRSSVCNDCLDGALIVKGKSGKEMQCR